MSHSWIRMIGYTNSDWRECIFPLSTECLQSMGTDLIGSCHFNIFRNQIIAILLGNIIPDIRSRHVTYSVWNDGVQRISVWILVASNYLWPHQNTNLFLSYKGYGIHQNFSSWDTSLFDLKWTSLSSKVLLPSMWHLHNKHEFINASLHDIRLTSFHSTTSGELKSYLDSTKNLFHLTQEALTYYDINQIFHLWIMCLQGLQLHLSWPHMNFHLHYKSIQNIYSIWDIDKF